jgi:hypothetical protein
MMATKIDFDDDYSWVTDEMFDEALEEICEEMGGRAVLQIPGVQEVVREALNNEALEHLERHRPVVSI